VFFNCHQLLSIAINWHRLSPISMFFAGGQNGNILQKKYGEMKLHNNHKFVHGENGRETE